MATMTKEQFHKMLIKSENECDGAELHLRHLFRHHSSSRIFYITGLDFTDMFQGKKDTSGIQIKEPNNYGGFSIPEFDTKD